jgi:septal ring factor EnvC (AmiA/AmiB activator)
MGKVVAGFGKYLDPVTKLQIFRKGIEIQTSRNQEVTAVSEGKIAFSGELPGMGRMLIIDHGDHFYTLCARLGELGLKTGQKVKKGERIGMSDAQGTPVYFEIRSRNIAINPMSWLGQAGQS